ncbi:MAG: XisI protein [Burkholderiales bacterium]|nr:XisI protein [Anaerolineae bacterium]
MDSLTEKVREVVAGYAGKALNGKTYLTQSADRTVFTVVGIARVDGKRVSSVSLIARIVGDVIVVELDQNDKPLVDALVQASILREQIILAYKGEPVPEPETV